MSLTKEFDDRLKESGNLAKSALDAGQKLILEHLLREINWHNYDTVSQVKGAINTHLDRLKGEE